MYHKVRICAIPILSFYTVIAITVSGCVISGCKSSQGSDTAKFVSSTADTTTGTTTPNTTTSQTSTTETTTDTGTNTTTAIAPAPPATAPTLAWDTPTTYTDGSALLNLKEYRVYFSTSHGPRSSGNYHAVSAPATSIKVNDMISLGTGTYYFVVTAVDSTNRESDPSNEVSRYLN